MLDEREPGLSDSGALTAFNMAAVITAAHVPNANAGTQNPNAPFHANGPVVVTTIDAPGSESTATATLNGASQRGKTG